MFAAKNNIYLLKLLPNSEHEITIGDPVQGCDSELDFWKHGSSDVLARTQSSWSYS